MRTVDYLLNNFVPFDDIEREDLESFRTFSTEYGDRIYDRIPGQATITASALVVNPDFTKVLVMYHDLHKTYSQFGGHADGNPDLFDVARKELSEESGAEGSPLSPDPIDIMRWNFPDRTKNGIFYPAHDLFDIAFLFMMPDDTKFNRADREVGDIRWITSKEWRDHHDAENPVVKANPNEQNYNIRTYEKIRIFAERLHVR